MTLARHATRRDSNEAAIVQALAAAGCRVWRLVRPFDLLVLRAGTWYVLEVKSRAGRLTGAQARDLTLGLPVHIVRTPDEALRAVGATKT